MKLLVIGSGMMGSAAAYDMARRPQVQSVMLADNDGVRARDVAARVNRITGEEKVRAAELDAVDALVIPGGESTTMSHLLRELDLLEPLRARLADGMPAYGSCAGMILLASEINDAGVPGREALPLAALLSLAPWACKGSSWQTNLTNSPGGPSSSPAQPRESAARRQSSSPAGGRPSWRSAARPATSPP